MTAGGWLILDQTAGTGDTIGRERTMDAQGVFRAIAGVTAESTSRVDGELPGYSIRFADESRQYPVLRNFEKLAVSSATAMAFVAMPGRMAFPASPSTWPVRAHEHHSAEEVLLSTVDATADDKLMRFALRLALAGHVVIPREAGFDFLPEAKNVFVPPRPKRKAATRRFKL